MNQPDLRVNLGPLSLRNPIMTASGTFGYGAEFADFVAPEALGAVVVKGISLAPRPGNAPPRVVETACGMLNSIGLENVGLAGFLADKLPFLVDRGATVVVNILGDSTEDYRRLAEGLSEVAGVAALEVNISCPNVKHGGVAFGTNPQMAAEVTRIVKENTKLPVIVKLSPNVTDITAVARAVAGAGADAVSLINTLLGMAIDIRRRRPRLANVVGGLSGPAIKPVALRMVWQVARAVDIPVIGIGGIATAEDAIEFMLAGASAVQIGTANFVDPAATLKVLEGVKAYLQEQKLGSVRELIGALEV